MACKCSVRLQAHVLAPKGIPRLYLVDILKDCRHSVPIRFTRESPTKPIGSRWRDGGIG
jgi:hypothetical protein